MLYPIENFLGDEEGASVIEYAVLIALIIAGVIVIIGVVGQKVDNGFERFNTLLTEFTE
ncbi:MAG: hypothetical protein P1P81_05230 [Desulfobulbales bacterium]|nr:hypothetical protein [Desulfobulbales bacterium]